MSNIALGTLYDLNKQMILRQPSLTSNQLKEIRKDLEDWFNIQIDGYAMLLCRDLHDYTIFHLYEKANINPPAIAAIELIDVLKNRGEILSIEKDSLNNGWEIWIKTKDDAFVYLLFNCDDFVIEC